MICPVRRTTPNGRGPVIAMGNVQRFKGADCAWNLYAAGVRCGVVPKPEELSRRKCAAAVGAARRSAVGDRTAAECTGRSQKKSQRAVRTADSPMKPANLASSAEKVGSRQRRRRGCVRVYANGLKKLASSIATRPATIAVLITPESPTLIIVARSQELSLDAGAISRN